MTSALSFAPRALRSAAAIAILCGFFSTRARAADQAPEPLTKKTTVSISPLHLSFPVLEVHAEFAMNRNVGVQGFAGYGSYEAYPLVELGAQCDYYALGSFVRGLQLGGELFYTHMWQKSDVMDVSASGDGVLIGPLVGYKLGFDFGLMLNLQLGAGYYSISASASNLYGRSASAATSYVAPFLNFLIGWSF